MIDKTLAVCGCIGKSLLEQTNPFQFGSRLAELFLFFHLGQHLGDKVRPSITGPSDKGPDIEIPWNDLVVKIEIYSPIDLMGFQSLEKYFRSLCKYLPVRKGFALEIRRDLHKRFEDLGSQDLGSGLGSCYRPSALIVPMNHGSSFRSGICGCDVPCDLPR